MNRSFFDQYRFGCSFIFSLELPELLLELLLPELLPELLPWELPELLRLELLLLGLPLLGLPPPGLLRLELPELLHQQEPLPWEEHCREWHPGHHIDLRFQPVPPYIC